MSGDSSSSDSSGESAIRRYVEGFRRSIERKFAESKTNREYRFPRIGERAIDLTDIRESLDRVVFYDLESQNVKRRLIEKTGSVGKERLDPSTPQAHHIPLSYLRNSSMNTHRQPRRHLTSHSQHSRDLLLSHRANPSTPQRLNGSTAKLMNLSRRSPSGHSKLKEAELLTEVVRELGQLDPRYLRSQLSNSNSPLFRILRYSVNLNRTPSPKATKPQPETNVSASKRDLSLTKAESPLKAMVPCLVRSNPQLRPSPSAAQPSSAPKPKASSMLRKSANVPNLSSFHPSAVPIRQPPRPSPYQPIRITTRKSPSLSALQPLSPPTPHPPDLPLPCNPPAAILRSRNFKNFIQATKKPNFP